MNKYKKIIAQVAFLAVALIAWQVAATSMQLKSFPDLISVCESLANAAVDDKYNILIMTGRSMLMILEGLGIGIVLAFLLSGFSVVSETFYAIYNLLVSIFDLLPAVALIPLCMIFIKDTTSIIVFLVVHSVVWPMSRSILDGFKSTPLLYIEAGKNIGLRGLRLVTGIYMPATFSYILSGLKVGWARAWRGLISAEMIIAGLSGIGFYIGQMRVLSRYGNVYASLVVIILIGIIVEYAIFYPIEKATVRKWGMVR